MFSNFIYHDKSKSSVWIIWQLNQLWLMKCSVRTQLMTFWKVCAFDIEIYNQCFIVYVIEQNTCLLNFDFRNDNRWRLWTRRSFVLKHIIRTKTLVISEFVSWLFWFTLVIVSETQHFLIMYDYELYSQNFHFWSTYNARLIVICQFSSEVVYQKNCHFWSSTLLMFNLYRFSPKT